MSRPLASAAANSAAGSANGAGGTGPDQPLDADDPAVLARATIGWYTGRSWPRGDDLRDRGRRRVGVGLRRPSRRVVRRRCRCARRAWPRRARHRPASRAGRVPAELGERRDARREGERSRSSERNVGWRAWPAAGGRRSSPPRGRCAAGGPRTRRPRRGRRGRRCRSDRSASCAEAAQDPVAAGVPTAVVDCLELVEVDEHERERSS